MHSIDDTYVIPSLKKQLSLLEPETAPSVAVFYSAEEIDMEIYDHVIVCMSGGKDSIACLLHLKDIGCDMNRVELWHHDVDGQEGSQLMDWPFMADYNRKLALTFGLPLYFSWLEGGFESELLKENSFSKPHKIETPDGLLTLERDKRRGKPGTRLRFPQISPSLQTRWCSSALKIDVGRRSLTNQIRFENKKILFITGERRQESANRAKYNQLEPHACDRRSGTKARHVDAWRPVLHWSEEQVWDSLKRHKVNAPVPYRLGWGRSSCMTCIYNAPKIWATIGHYFPNRLDIISKYESQFGTTISRDRINVVDITNGVKPIEIDDLEALEQACKREYDLPVLIEAGAKWKVPAGAFVRERCGAL